MEEENNVLKMELQQKTAANTNENLTDNMKRKKMKIQKKNNKKIEEITEILGKRKKKIKEVVQY